MSNHSINHLKTIFKGEDLIQTEEVNELKVVFTVSFFVGNPVYELIRNTILITSTPPPIQAVGVSQKEESGGGGGTLSVTKCKSIMHLYIYMYM